MQRTKFFAALTLMVLAFILTGCDHGNNGDKPINITAIAGVTPPATGKTPVTAKEC
ncbi:MAG: hypothetical protein LBH44_03635 [Treponema sp.]|nr:hypothetical protein [Treponema sp.]